MCNGSKQKTTPADSVIESNEIEKGNETPSNLSVLLELSASDDLAGFKTAVEQDRLHIDEPSSWYGRRIGSKKMAFEDRTPLMVASLFGSKNVLGFILESGQADVNRSSGSDHATALHCAVAGGATSSLDIVKALLRSSANANSLDVNGNRPVDLISSSRGLSLSPKKKMMESLLKGRCIVAECVLDDLVIDEFGDEKDKHVMTPVERKEYPVDITLPDIKNGIYSTDEFRMYMFKVKPCSRAYSHDWTECPFVHPGENARRRDPRKYHYSCVPCPEFRKGTCRQGDNCDYAHGIFECWLHPAQYRTRLCKDETNCSRRVCFFAHKTDELRPLYASTGSGLPSPRSYSNGLEFSSLMMPSMSLSSPSAWNIDDVFAVDAMSSSQQMRSSYAAVRASSSFGMDSASSSTAARAAMFAKKSLSFIDRGTTSLLSGYSSSTLSPTGNFGSTISDWGSPDGVLDWGIKKDEINKLRKSASFGFRSSGSSSFNAAPTASRLALAGEPDVSWVQSLVKDGPTADTADSAQNLQYLYLEQEQMVA